MSTITIKDTSLMREFGAWLAGHLTPGSTVSLEGPLGAGKTTLVQGLAFALGIENVTSPTFVLFKTFKITKKNKLKGLKWLVHADAYRLKKPQEILAAGLGEYLGDPDTITVIEWGDLIKNILPKGLVRIKIRIIKSGRKISYPASLGEPNIK